MTLLANVLSLLIEVVALLLAVWLLWAALRFLWLARARRKRLHEVRAKRSRRLRDRPVPVDRRVGPRREEDLVDEALDSRSFPTQPREPD